MPHLEKELWQPLKDSGLTVLIVGREHNLAEVIEYKSRMKLSMLALADADRSIYARYAKKSIPRTFVIDRDGSIVLSELGFSPDKFEQMKALVYQLLSSKQSGTTASSLSPVRIPFASTSSLKNNAASLQSPLSSMPTASAPMPLDDGGIAMRSALHSIGLQQYDAATADLEAFLKKWPQHAQAHYLLAVCYSFKKNYDRAGDEYKSAIKYTTDSKLRGLAELGLKKIGR